MELKSPTPCPKTVTVRRNPPRRARPTPATVVPLSAPPSSKTASAIRSFPIQDILSIDVPERNEFPEPSSPKDPPSSPEKLKVFLRIKPIVTQAKVGVSLKNAGHKNVWPQNPNKRKDSSKTNKAVSKKTSDVCLKMTDSHSVTLCPPQSLADARRTKSEVYEGFSHVFSAESSQNEVYETMVNPLVEDFLKGKSGMIAAMGPSGSGKTHTVFGSAREPGMVPLALRRIFSEESNGSNSSRIFYLSMFEIYSERGKGEKIMDLSQEGGDLYMQQSVIKGLKETVINDVQSAESLIASGMLKRSTAMTNSNIQSSRSQCIINIRCDVDNVDFHSYFHNGGQSCTALLTIVDLAGAEREKKTGNQGARLLESNFINNTSMVFGLCLRSLLEHQKNPKKPFHKHFQNSLLTKYLRDFLEGKKRMALILTAKSGEEDYHDTSYMLRQASPYMNIKFENVEEQPANALGNKKRTQTLQKSEHAKRMKFNNNNNNEVSLDAELKDGFQHQILKEELTPEKVKEVDELNRSVESPCNINTEVNRNKSLKENTNDSVKIARENHILLNFSRALWNVLKEYKNKLEASENEVSSLRHSLAVEKERRCELETELNLIKSSCLCGKESVEDVIEENGPKATSTSCSYRSVGVHESTSSVEAVSTSASGHQSFQEQSKEKDDPAPNEYVVFDKGDLKELDDNDFVSEISGCDKFESDVTDSELHIIQEDETSSFVKGEEQQHEKEEGISCVEVISISTGPETFEEQCNNKVDVSSTNVAFDNKQEFKEVEEREANKEASGWDSLKPGGVESELCFVHEDEVSSSPLVFHSKQEEKEKVNVSEKQKVKEAEETKANEEIASGRDSEVSLVHEIKVSSTLKEDQPQQEETQKADLSSTNIVLHKQELKEIEEREANAEITGGVESELLVVLDNEVSSSPLVFQPKQEEKEKVDVSEKEKVKETEERETSEDSEVSLVVHGKEASSTLKEQKGDLPDSKLTCPEDVSKLPEASNIQPCKSSSAVKPKRRLRPASSVMLRNISVMDSFDATEMPKHGKRGGEKDGGGKRTQGSLSLMRLLKQNLNH